MQTTEPSEPEPSEADREIIRNILSDEFEHYPLELWGKLARALAAARREERLCHCACEFIDDAFAACKFHGDREVAAVAREREACAQVLERFLCRGSVEERIGRQAADAIRARGGEGE